MPSTKQPLVRPLTVRDGARYRCFGDGLCCSDIHGLGPLTRREWVDIRRIDKQGARYSEPFEDYMLSTAADGACTFLLADMRCGIHAEHGPERKPSGCQGFPLGLTATPEGGRITTDHRCPCRTMGDRPPVTVQSAEPMLCDTRGRLAPNRRVDTVRLTRRARPVSFARYRAIETDVLALLEAGAPPEEALGAAPFPELAGRSWAVVAEEFVQAKDGTRFGDAIAWFGDSISHLLTGARRRSPGRPWAAAFDRAEARSPRPETARAVIADWVADEIWSLKWAEERTWATARAELATRVAVAHEVVDRLRTEGLREDRAAAEAVMIIEAVGESEYWGGLVKLIRL